MIKTIESEKFLPVDPASGNRIPPSSQPGYYPGYSTLRQRNYWDEATRKLIEHRVYRVPQIRFFDEIEALTMRAVADRLVPQGA